MTMYETQKIPVKDHPDLSKQNGAVVASKASMERWKKQREHHDIITILNEYISYQRKINEEIMNRLNTIEQTISKEDNA